MSSGLGNIVAILILTMLLFLVCIFCVLLICCAIKEIDDREFFVVDVVLAGFFLAIALVCACAINDLVIGI